MRAIKYLVAKEFLQIFRNTIIVRFIIGYPVLVLLILPWAISFEVSNINIAVVDRSNSVSSSRLTEKIAASPYFTLQSVIDSYDDAFRKIDDGSISMILEIPHDFDLQLATTRHSTLFVASNAVNGMQSLLGTNYLTQIINDYAAQISAETSATAQLRPTVEIVPNYRFNRQMDYKSFMLPAFISLIITLICGILPALNIVIEKETGTIQQINTTPVSRFSFIISKLIPYWIIGVFIFTISYFIVGLVYGLYPSGNIFLLYLVAIIYIIGISGLGIIISNYSDTLQQAMFLVMFLILIIILLSGLFTPISGMPTWAQYIARCNPLSYAVDIVRMLYLKAAMFADILRPLFGLLFFAFGLNLWAVVSYRKRA